jgi:magnesium transporter
VQVLTRLDRGEIVALRERSEFFWLDLVQPTDAELETLGELFGLHPMVLEDMHERDQRPKLDEYGEYVLVVFYSARAEVELVIHGDYLVSVRHDPCQELIELQETFSRREAGSEQFVVYRVLDTLTDTFFPILSSVDDDIDELENVVIQEPTEAQLQRIFRLKRDLVTMRKVITPQRDLFARAGDDIIQLPGLEPGTRDYFRDVYDHLIRISDLIDSYRDLLTGAMDVYLSTVSNRLNVVMKRLTVVATVFLPLSFIVGFFGQNFGWMVQHVGTLTDFVVFGIGSLVASCVALVVWFHRSGIE